MLDGPAVLPVSPGERGSFGEGREIGENNPP